jgi:hypothetical protein
VGAKVERIDSKENPRFVVTSLTSQERFHRRYEFAFEFLMNFARALRVAMPTR